MSGFARRAGFDFFSIFAAYIAYLLFKFCAFPCVQVFEVGRSVTLP